MSSAFKQRGEHDPEEATRAQVPPPNGDVGAICATIRDLYSREARRLIGRVLSDYLEAAKLTPIELLYSDKHLTALSGAGTTLLQAIQKAAALQVRGTERGVGERIKELFKLVDGASPRTRDILTRPKPLGVQPSDLAALLAAAADAPEADRDDMANAAIAARLEGCRSWAEKIERLARACDANAGERTVGYVDAGLAEVLSFKPALDAVLGLAARDEGRPQLLADLIGSSSEGGALDSHAPRTDAGQALARLLAAHPCHGARDALADHLADLLDRIGMSASPSTEEFAALSRLCRSLRRTRHWAWSAELVAALERRFTRVITRESTAGLIGPMPDGGTEAERIVDIHDDIVGSPPRQVLLNHLDDRLTPSRIKTSLAPPSRGPVAHLRAIARLHQRIAQSAIENGRRSRLCARLEQAQDELVRANELLASMERQGSTADKAMALLDLCRPDVLVAKTVRNWVKRQAVSHMQQADFLPCFLEGAKTEAEKTQRLLVLQQRMAQAGMVEKSAQV